MTVAVPTVSRVELKERKTPWKAIYAAVGFLTFCGAQMSVYYMSTLQYLKQSYDQTTVETFGYVVAAGSFGVMIASPCFGYWQQRTNSTKQPAICGFALATIGNVMYGFLCYYGSNVLCLALISRFLSGFAPGAIGVYRSFIATSSTQKDRIKAVAMGNCGLTLGLSIGPVIQILFLPFGIDGYLWIFPINMYTTCAYFMAVICLLCIVLLITAFTEDYVGIYSDEDKKSDPSLIIPKYDIKPVLVCLYLWFNLSMVSTTIESLSVPLTSAMYGWKNSDSILYNGIFMTATSLFSMFVSFILAKTKIKKIDRRLQIIFGQASFCAYFVFCYPFSFYGDSLPKAPLVNGTENLDIAGGCSNSYDWCETTAPIPLAIYVFFFTAGFGFAFPFVSSPMNAVYSEVLGPRKQGTMQGLMAFTGSVAQLTTPLIITAIFNVSGYRYIMLYHFALCIIGILLILICFKHMIPLQIQGALGRTLRYKQGQFTRL